MSNCNPACKAKIILNGGRVVGEINSVKELIEQVELTEAEAYQLIAILDEAEDKLIEFNNRVLAKTGYTRRTPDFTLDKV